MLDATDVLALRPKISILSVAAIKNELVEAQASAIKEKSKRNLTLLSDSEQTTFDGSATQPISFHLNNKPRSVKVKEQKKTVSVTALVTKITSGTTESVLVFQVFDKLEPIKAMPISAVPSTTDSSSH